ncbi:MAG: hypothetical protein K2Y40_22235 [Reyranella sp.]|nr:hypothetical protein [Reyranella sp.]
MDLLGQRLVEELRARGIVPEHRRGEITFLNNRNLFFQFLPLALFAPVDSGAFEIKAKSIDYKLSCVLSLALVLPMLGLMFVLGLVASSVPLTSLVLAWLLLTVTSYAIMDMRLKRMLRRVASRS